MLPAASKRLQWVDAGRGLAALSVTLYHFQIGAGVAHVTHLPWMIWLNWPGARLAVPLFFVISGFSIHYSERAKIQHWAQKPAALRGYCSRRLWRIYPPYAAALLLAILVRRACGAEPTTGPDLAAHLLMVHQFIPAYFNSINVVLWSVGVEMWLYLLYPCALHLLEKRGLRFAGTTVFLASALSIAMTARLSSGPNVVGLWFVLNLFFGWCLGAALAEGYLHGNLFFLSARWWVAGAGLLLLTLAIYDRGLFDGALWPVFIPALVVLSAWLLALLLILEQRPALTAGAGNIWFGPLRWLGTISYSLYLVHEPLINARGDVIEHLTNLRIRQLVFCLYFAVPFLVAWLSWKFVERPSMKMSKRLKAAVA